MSCKEGIVKNISDKGYVVVEILRTSACTGCHAKEYCTSADMRETTIEVQDYPSDLCVGDRVSVLYTESMGLRAVLYSFGIPLVLLLLCVILAHAFALEEGYVVAISLALIIGYYGLLTLLRPHFRKHFCFKVQKSSE